MRAFAIATLPLAASLAACSAPRAPGEASAPRPSAVRYEVALASAEPWSVDVKVTFEGGVKAGVIAFPPAVSGLTVEEDGARREPEQHGRSYRLGCARTCTARYRFDLSGAAELTKDAATVAVRSGGDLVAPAHVWLMWPEPADPRAPATLRVDARDPASGGRERGFAAPFPRDDATGEYRLLTRDVAGLGYTAWGSFATLSAPVTRGIVDVAILRGARRADDAAIGRWITATALALDSVYGRFPVGRALVVVVPSAGSNVVELGRTVPAGGASILLLVGADAGERELFDDWVLAHELFHLGVPSMARDGRWLDEGLATYYEPVLRARAGLLGERDLWTELMIHAPSGVATEDEPRLSAAEGHDRVYFGGSLFALAADVEIRERTGGARSLDDGLRRALAEGATATEVWPVTDFIAALDRGVGAPVVRELYDRVARAGAPCPRSLRFSPGPIERCAPDDAAQVIRLFHSLGVRWGAGDEAEIHDDAALAAVRRGIGRRDEVVASAVAKSAQRANAGAGSARVNAGVEKP